MNIFTFNCWKDENKEKRGREFSIFLKNILKNIYKRILSQYVEGINACTLSHQSTNFWSARFDVLCVHFRKKGLASGRHSPPSLIDMTHAISSRSFCFYLEGGCWIFWINFLCKVYKCTLGQWLCHSWQSVASKTTKDPGLNPLIGNIFWTLSQCQLFVETTKNTEKDTRNGAFKIHMFYTFLKEDSISNLQ